VPPIPADVVADAELLFPLAFHALSPLVTCNAGGGAGGAAGESGSDSIPPSLALARPGIRRLAAAAAARADDAAAASS